VPTFLYLMKDHLS